MAERGVRRPVELAEVAQQPVVRLAPASTGLDREAVRFALLAQRVQPRRDDAERLVPGDLLPARILVAALLRVGPDLRSFVTIRVVEDVHAQMALRAELAVGHRVVRRAVDRVHLAVGHRHVDPATRRTLVAHVLDDLRFRNRLRGSLRLGVRRRHAPRGHRRGAGDPGRGRSLEEGPAFDALHFVHGEDSGASKEATGDRPVTGLDSDAKSARALRQAGQRSAPSVATNSSSHSAQMAIP
jgi:hypothetical protein